VLEYDIAIRHHYGLFYAIYISVTVVQGGTRRNAGPEEANWDNTS
jgi:hypothetical protein